MEEGYIYFKGAIYKIKKVSEICDIKIVMNEESKLLAIRPEDNIKIYKTKEECLEAIGGK